MIELILAVLKQEEPNPSILCFILKLTGIFAAFEGCFHHLQVSHTSACMATSAAVVVRVVDWELVYLSSNPNSALKLAG